MSDAENRSWSESIQEASDELGIPMEESLAAIRGRVEGAPYPGPECLVPEEVELLASLEHAGVGEGGGELPGALEERLGHLRECASYARRLSTNSGA